MEKASVIFLAFLQRNGMVAVVILAVFAVRALLRKCPKKYSYALWAIVGIRMLFDLNYLMSLTEHLSTRKHGINISLFISTSPFSI